MTTEQQLQERIDNREQLPAKPLTTADLAGSTHEIHAAPDGGDHRSAPLFAQGETEQFRSSWNDIQTGFVDEPRDAVQRADELVARCIKRLAEVFAEERTKWNTSGTAAITFPPRTCARHCGATGRSSTACCRYRICVSRQSRQQLPPGCCRLLANWRTFQIFPLSSVRLNNRFELTTGKGPRGENNETIRIRGRAICLRRMF
jgi:hypothetical protein